MAMADHAAPGALDGVTVLDLSRILAGPYCTQMLADHGARVIKVEATDGDATRQWGPPFIDEGSSAYYAGVNRNKESIRLDLTDDRDRATLLDLAARSDVLVENFRAGTMEKWGLGYDDVLQSRFPRLVYARITGFGVDGPKGGDPGYDAVVQAYSGLMSINGEATGDPIRMGSPVVDLFTGALAFGGVLLALNERTRSGCGQLVDLTLLDSAVNLLFPHSAIWLADGRVPKRTGSAHPTIAPYESFTTQRGHIFIAATTDAQFSALLLTLGVPELAGDQRFRGNAGRVRNVEELRGILRPLVERWDPEKLADELLGVGVAASPVYDVAQALTSPQIVHRGLVRRHGAYQGIASPIRLTRTPGGADRGVAELGQHTSAVLAELAGGDGPEPERHAGAGVSTRKGDD